MTQVFVPVESGHVRGRLKDESLKGTAKCALDVVVRGSGNGGVSVQSFGGRAGSRPSSMRSAFTSRSKSIVFSNRRDGSKFVGEVEVSRYW